MTRILIHTDKPQRHMARLTEAFPEAAVEGVSRNSALPGKLESQRAEVLFSVNITSDAPYPRDAVLGTETLCWVAVGGSGTDHLNPWDPARLTVTNSAGVAAEAMADYILGAFLHFNLDVSGLMADQAARVWDTQRSIRPLNGRTLLILGLGETGRCLAARAQALGMTVIGTRARPQHTPGCDEVHGPDSLPQLWPRADFIAVCTPGLPSTRGLVSAQAFALMRADAVLVNVSRGGVVDEAALAEALRHGRLRGAASDVFATEPLPEDDPLWEVPNLLISPHCSGVFTGWEDAAFSRFLENLRRRAKGQPLENVVDPARGY